MMRISILALFVTGMPTQAVSQPAPLSLTLQGAVQLALERSPTLGATVAGVTAAGARMEQASLRPQIEVGLEFENFAGSGDLQGSEALESTLQFSRALETGDKRRHRVAIANAGRNVALAELDAARLDVAADAARKFVGLLRAQEDLLAARRFFDLSQGISNEARRRVEAGRALSAELYRSRAEVGRQQLAVLSAEAERDSAWRTLAATWGEPDAQRAEAAGDLFDARPLEPLPELLARIEVSPSITILAAGERLREAERRMALAQRKPDVALALGLRHLNEPGDMGLVAGATVSLGSRARGRALAAERTALLEQARATRAAGVTSAVAIIARLHRLAESRRQALEVLARDIVPATRAALEQVERGYRLGRLSYGEYALAARESLDAEFERVRVATAYHELVTDIESLTGIAVQPGEHAQ